LAFDNDEISQKARYGTPELSMARETDLASLDETVSPTACHDV
jgi:hypothetical protein